MGCLLHSSPKFYNINNVILFDGFTILESSHGFLIGWFIKLIVYFFGDTQGCQIGRVVLGSPLSVLLGEGRG